MKLVTIFSRKILPAYLGSTYYLELANMLVRRYGLKKIGKKWECYMSNFSFLSNLKYNLFLYYPSVNAKREWECPRYS